MTSLKKPALVLASLVLLLAGCGGSDSDGNDDTPTDDNGGTSQTTDETGGFDVEPAEGNTIETEYFTYTVPQGWEDRSELLPSAVTVAGDITDDDGFTDNLNVLRISPLPTDDLDELEVAAITELEGIDARDILIKDRVEVDGRPAIHIGSGLTQQGVDYLIEQYAIVTDDASFVATFSFSDTVAEADRVKIAESILTTWTWTN